MKSILTLLRLKMEMKVEAKMTPEGADKAYTFLLKCIGIGAGALLTMIGIGVMVALIRWW